jgi:hypothetical protein
MAAMKALMLLYLAFEIVLVLIIWQNGIALGSSNCIFYDPSDKVITVKCKTANLRDIDNQLRNPNILGMESKDAYGN